MGRTEQIARNALKRKAKRKGVKDVHKYVQQQEAKKRTTWTDSKGTITQASKKGEKVGEHVSHHRGKGGKGKPDWKQRTWNTVNRVVRRNRLKIKK